MVRAIGVDVTEGFVYEGDNNRGLGVLADANAFRGYSSWIVISSQTAYPKQDDLACQLLFREDSFDAVTRLRRGRFYERSGGSQPHQWYVEPHPGTMHVSAHLSTAGVYPRILHGFRAFAARHEMRAGAQPSILAFGARSAYSLWRVVDIERTVTGEDLVTLRARSSLGLLPELRESAVPPMRCQRSGKCLKPWRSLRIPRPQALSSIVRETSH